MGRFTFRGGAGGTQLVQYDDVNEEVSFVTIPAQRMRSLGESLIELADAKDALTEYFSTPLKEPPFEALIADTPLDEVEID
jgi:hypothetical protein